MGGTILGRCWVCDMEIDIDPLTEATSDNRICDSCKEDMPECLGNYDEHLREIKGE
jgi:hypothetical protein